jgi:general stress protein 26
VSDAGEKAKHWKDDWAKFYKDGSRSDEYLLIRITPMRLEISSSAHGMNNDPKTWKPVIVNLK